jgi:hypothetical protein
LSAAATRSWVRFPRCTVSRADADGTLSGRGADDTRFVLPAGAGAPGRMVAVAVEGVAGEHPAGRAA